MSMIQCKHFSKKEKFEPPHGNIIYSPMYQLNNWDQKDVESIISIDTCYNQHGEIETIVVYYNTKEMTE